ncbi:hypothetical protein ANO11243_082750 [Dothideomycetidae sp. 11243]|nr:hypothetical protein ANO11243_082750 [fungal sp. No.11243]
MNLKTRCCGAISSLLSKRYDPGLLNSTKAGLLLRHSSNASINTTAGSKQSFESFAKRRGRAYPQDQAAQREFFFDILNVSATRRDAKQYLSQFKHDSESPTTSPAPPAQPQQPPRAKFARGINLGSLYAPTTAIGSSPVFHEQTTTEISPSQSQIATMHAALVSIRSPEHINDKDLDGVALTLSQLVRLGMRIVLTFDCDYAEQPIVQHKVRLEREADRLAKFVGHHNPAGARYLEGTIQCSEESDSAVSGALNVSLPNLIVEPLKRNCVPIVPCLAYTTSCQATAARYSDVIAALTRSLAGIERGSSSENLISLDRLIMIDSLGGIPSTERADGSHVFVNMEQEYDDIASQLSNSSEAPGGANSHHLTNLRTLKDCLAVLPPTSSALVISPEEAASSSRPAGGDTDPASIRTRRQKNPLIHNLLTNRPIISSSLPVARVWSTNGHRDSPTSSPSRSTLVKRGMPVTMIPDTRKGPWTTSPSGGTSDVTLDRHKQIQFSRLLELVEDSFRRKLDVPGYLRRVKDHVAGVIIAGEYEGGAILTWESPPGSDNDSKRLVPYLDKFAVLQKAQGNAGVADIVFQCMVRTCFPQGVCWRSRSVNPVNKWYFERSIGTWKLPGGYWTMFWTTPNEELVLDKQKWSDYVAVCQGVMPTWADGKKAE